MSLDNISLSVRTKLAVHKSNVSETSKVASFGAQIQGKPYNQTAESGASLGRGEPIPSPEMNPKGYLEHFLQPGGEFNQSAAVYFLLNDRDKRIGPPTKDTVLLSGIEKPPEREPLPDPKKGMSEGVCVAFSSLWLREMFSFGSDNKTSGKRMDQLSANNAAREAVVLQRVYMNLFTDDRKDTAFSDGLAVRDDLQQQMEDKGGLMIKRLNHLNMVVGDFRNAQNKIEENIDALVADYDADIEKSGLASVAEQKAMSPALEEKMQTIRQARQEQEKNSERLEFLTKVVDTVQSEFNILIRKWGQYRASDDEYREAHTQIRRDRGVAFLDIDAVDKQVLRFAGLTATKHIGSSNPDPSVFMESLANKLPAGNGARYGFRFIDHTGRGSTHSTALFRSDENTMVFFDPNCGEYHVPAKELVQFLSTFIKYAYPGSNLVEQKIILTTLSDGKGDILAVQSAKAREPLTEAQLNRFYSEEVQTEIAQTKQQSDNNEG